MQSKNKVLRYVVLLAFFIFSYAFTEELSIKLKDIVLYGTLSFPVSSEKTLCIIVPGSGPTDRDGNNIYGLRCDCYKMLAQSLNESGFATFCYDKRGVGKSISATLKEEDIVFQTGVEDLKSIIKHFRSSNRFQKIFLLGHSEGSLISILVAKEEKIEGLISISGVGKNAKDIIMEQISASSNMNSELKNVAKGIVEKLRAGKKVKDEDIPPMLRGLFRSSVQPYLISYFKIEPAEEIASLGVPVLILHGELDSQVPKENATLLVSGNKNIKVSIISEMGHVLKEVKDVKEGMEAYYIPTYPISKTLLKEILSFIKNNNV